MARNSSISWTNNTFNPWWGCSKIAAGCDNCYAAAFDNRVGGEHWKGKPPRLTSDDNWKQPKKWNEQAEKQGMRIRVFCGSMMDWCDKNAPEGALDRLWDLIRATPYLDWQLLTKRATLIERRLPADWGKGYDNVWLGVTVENKKQGIPRLEALSKIDAKVKFLSCEPLLEDLGEIDLSRIDWVIVGGESGPGFRPMEKQWALNLIDHSFEEMVPVWFKQWGGNAKDKGGSIFEGRVIQDWPIGHHSRVICK